jgi:hypothetical protein
MQEIVDWLNGIIWSNALIFLCLGAGLFFSILTRFVQVRLFKEMIRLLFASKESERGISSFQALSVSLSGRVGTGNIAGSNRRWARSTRKNTKANTGVDRPSILRRPWARNGMHGFSPLRQ